jgi:hypothetical protein
MIDVLVSAESGHLVGKTPADAEAICELDGGVFRAVLTVPAGRSPSQMRLWWAVCGMIADNFDSYILTAENVSDILKLECGHCVVWRDAAGAYRRSPKSIAFNKLDQAAFTALLDTMLGKASELFGAGLADAARDELTRIAAPDLRAA